jgi:hypothetical protein
MSKEKNKNTFRVAALLLVACLISSVMLSGTFAKYTSEYSGQDTALVAKWDLTMKDQDDNEFSIDTPEQQLDLFSHAYDTNILADAGEQKIIAPGVSGNFVLSLTNNSDVAADITFDITKTGANVPMEFSIGKDFHDEGATILQGHAALQDALNTLNTAPESDGLIRLAAVEGEAIDTETITVYWQWAYERKDTVDPTVLTQNDEDDTSLGTESATGDGNGAGGRNEYILNITITATQAPLTVTP